METIASYLNRVFLDGGMELADTKPISNADVMRAVIGVCEYNEYTLEEIKIYNDGRVSIDVIELPADAAFAYEETDSFQRIEELTTEALSSIEFAYSLTSPLEQRLSQVATNA